MDDEETTTDDDTTTSEEDSEDEDYDDEIEEYIEMLEEAIEIFFENLESGLSIHDALETDMALRASIAVSYSLATCIEEVEEYIEAGYSVAET
jgi:hypothetical protein